MFGWLNMHVIYSYYVNHLEDHYIHILYDKKQAVFFVTIACHQIEISARHRH